MAGWEHGFDEAGVWCAQRACTWLAAHKEAIAASKEAAAQAKAATKPLEQLRHPELKERCAALGLDPVGTRAVLVARLQRAQGAAQAPPPAGRPAAPPKPKPAPNPAPKPAPERAPIPPLPAMQPPAQPLKPPACQRRCLSPPPPRSSTVGCRPASPAPKFSSPSPLSQSRGRSPARLPPPPPPVDAAVAREAAAFRRDLMHLTFEAESESLEMFGVTNRRFFPARVQEHVSDTKYAECPQLKALAVHLHVDLVCIDGLSLTDGCNLYKADGAEVVGAAVSWRETLLPRLQRQRAGGRLPFERPLSVLVWNGLDHFDAAVLAVGRTPAPHGRGGGKRVGDAPDESMNLPATRRRRLNAVIELEPSSSCEMIGAVDGDAVWPSVAAMLDPVGLEKIRVPGDGACAYWGVLSTIDGGLPRGFFANGRRPLLEREPVDRDACDRMRALRRAAVDWLLAPEQRSMLCAEPALTQTFEGYAASRFMLCSSHLRNFLRAQARLPIPARNARDVVRADEAVLMMVVCEQLAAV